MNRTEGMPTVAYRFSGRLRTVGFPVIIAFCGLMIVALIDQRLFLGIQKERLKLLEFESMELKVKLESYLQNRFTTLTAIASFYETEGQVSPQEFMDFAAKLYHEIGGFRSLQYADPDNVVAVSYPARGASPVGHRLMETPFTRPFVLKAIQTRKTTVNDPYELITTRHPGFVARKPIFRHGKYFGLAIGVFEVVPLVERVFSRRVLARFDFRLVDSKGATFYSSVRAFPSEFNREMVEVGDNFWYLDLVLKHSPDAQAGATRGLIWGLGVVCSLLLGAIVFFREERKRQGERMAIFQAEKLAAVGRLATGVAHEILNPLNIIGIVAQETLLDEKVPEETRHRSNLIWEQVQRITKIADSLKRVARQTSHNRTEVEVPSLVDSALSLVNHEIRAKGIEVEKDLGVPAPIRADGDELTRVLVNLFTNAIEAMESGEEKRLRIQAKAIMRGGGPWLKLQVSDTGKGIAPEDVKRVFEPFFTRKQTQGGTGLGLSLCHAIIEEHGGQIQVESTLGGGSTFTLFLPTSTRDQLGG